MFENTDCDIEAEEGCEVTTMITCDRSFGNNKFNPLLENKGKLNSETKKEFEREISKLERKEEKHHFYENTNSKLITHREGDITININKTKKMTLAEIKNTVGKPISFIQSLHDGLKFKGVVNKVNLGKLNNSVCYREIDSPMILSRLHGKD